MIPLRGFFALGVGIVVLAACLESTPDALQLVPDLPPAESRLAKSLPFDITPVAASSVPDPIYPDTVRIQIKPTQRQPLQRP